MMELDYQKMSSLSNEIVGVMMKHDTTELMDFAVILKLAVMIAINNGESAEDFAKVCYLTHSAMSMSPNTEGMH